MSSRFEEELAAESPFPAQVLSKVGEKGQLSRVLMEWRMRRGEAFRFRGESWVRLTHTLNLGNSSILKAAAGGRAFQANLGWVGGLWFRTNNKTRKTANQTALAG